MTICLKTGAKVWIEETGKIYSCDLHKLDNGTFVIYHALEPLTDNIQSFRDARF